MSYLMQDTEGQVLATHSVSAGLDYPSVGPEHAWLKDAERATYVNAADDQAVAAFKLLSELEGIIPALEPAHALAYVANELAPALSPEQTVLVCLSGRGDKDINTIMELGQT
jgi:tryptophan synthase beta chain